MGGSGDDTIFGGPGDDSIDGGEGNDTILSGGGLGDDDTIFGGPGDDSMAGSAGNETIQGGEGDDTIFGGPGDDSLDGGDGNDTLVSDGGPGELDTIFGGPGDDSIVGSDGSETLLGGDGDDTIFGAPGDDSIDGGDGDDLITSGGGIDSIFGGPGNDRLTGSVNVKIDGGAGDDFITGGIGGNEFLVGGDGDDTIASGGGANDSLFGSAGSDVLVLDGPSQKVFGGTDVVGAPPADDQILIETDANITITSGALPNSAILLVNGVIVAELSDVPRAVIAGGAGNNLIDATAFLGDAVLMGGAGNDTLLGGQGNDELEGGVGDDLLVGGPGNDTYFYSGTQNLGRDTVDEATDQSSDGLDFFGLAVAVNVDLSLTGIQTVATGFVELSLLNPNSLEKVTGSVYPDTLRGNDRQNTLVGGGGRDYVYGGSGDDYLTAARTRYVYLDFDSETTTVDHVYTQAERDGIQARIEADFSAFDVVVTQSVPVNQIYEVIRFNHPPVVHGREVSGGVSERIGFRDTARGGAVQVDVNGFLGVGTNRLPPNEQNFIALSSTIASHELAHMYGLRHHDAFGSPGAGIFSKVPSTWFLPVFAGPQGAIETSDHLIASPASVRTTLSDALANPYFGEREALKLAYFETGESVQELLLSQKTDSVSLGGIDYPVQQLGALQSIAVPNTLTSSLALNYNVPLDAAATTVIGSIDLAGGKSENDIYSFTGNVGDVITVELMSFALRTRYANTIDSVLRLYAANGQLVELVPYHGHQLGAFNDDGFEPTDSILIDVRLPSSGTYFVEVDTFSFHIPEFPQYITDFDAASFCAGRVGDIRCDDTDTGDYELLIYRFAPGNNATPGDSLVGGAGADTFVGASGNDVYFSDGLDVFAGPVGPFTSVSNNPPTLVSVNNLPPRQEPMAFTVDEHQLLQFNILAADPDTGDVLSYRLLPLGSSAFPTGVVVEATGSTTGQFRWTPGLDGSFEALLEVRDLHGVTVVQPLSITVNNTDVAAQITNVTAARIEGTPITISAVGIDPTGAASTFNLSFEVLQGSNIVTSDNLASPADFAFTPADNGSYLVRVTATGDNQVVGVASQLISVANVAPLFDAGPDETLPALSAGVFTRTIDFIDPGADSWFGSVNYGDGSPAQALVIDAANNRFTLNHVFLTPGIYAVSILLNDDDLGSHSGAFDVVINQLNSPPTVVNPIVDQNVDEDSAPITIDLTSVFADIDDTTLTLAASSSNGSLVAASLSGNLLTLTLATNASGSATITVTATDSGNLVATDTFIVTVQPTNDGPTVVNPIVDQSAIEDSAPITIDLTGVFADVDDTTLTLAASSSNGSLVTTSLSGNLLTLTLAPNASGSATITVTATDSGNLVATDTFIVTVQPTNDGPTVVNPIVDQISKRIRLQLPSISPGVFADVDDTTLTGPSAGSAWIRLSLHFVPWRHRSSNGSLVATSLSGNLLTLTLAPNASGSATITVTATDSGNLVATDTFIVTVQPTNDGPTVVNPIVDQNAIEDSVPITIDLTSVFADVDDTTLTFAASSSNGSLVATSLSGNLLTLTLAPNASGSATITVTATDSGNLVATDTFVVAVQPANDAPTVVNPIVDQNAIEDAVPITIDLTSVFADVDSMTLTLAASSSNGSLVTASLSGNLLTLTLAPNASGSATITVTATDSGNLVATDTFVVAVQPTNDGPTVVNPIVDQSRHRRFGSNYHRSHRRLCGC